VFSKVLVANRGEIARRVLSTCRRLGIATVAVYSDADEDAVHVIEADECVRLGPAPASESYLDAALVLEAAIQTGAEAIHPGYGFLSENTDFALACAAAGITFIGPSPESIRVMGDKGEAKRLLEPAGVPVVPGVHRDDLTDDDLVAAAVEVGFPVLVKAVAGGGGKGMRAVHVAADLPDALQAARREARNAFGDDRLIMERLVEQPRHVEVQVFGDTHGNIIHLRERECSVQRRHQKVVEETPSPAVDDDLRERMGAAAVAAAKRVDYVGAGTVEFLLAPTGEFFFLEMNTRLQVEHPVTELITGLDLVELQLRVAAGEPLGISQAEVTGTGHAIEVRVYAEDPDNGFLPQTGPVTAFEVPRGPDVRVDSGVVSGSEVSRFYDPMLAKVIVHGPDRASSLARMADVLLDTTILGVTTNIEYLHRIVTHPVFLAGDATTAFLDEEFEGLGRGPVPLAALVAAAAAIDEAVERPPVHAGPAAADPWVAVGPWRGSGIGGWHLRLQDNDDEHALVVARWAGALTVLVDDGRHEFSLQGGHGLWQVSLGDHDVTARVEIVGDDVWVHADGLTRRLVRLPETHHRDPGAPVGGGGFTSPMPGAVLEVRVAAGDHVEAGATLVVVEAMKMEHPVRALAAGTVDAVHVAAGDAVDAGAELLSFTPDTDQ